MGTVANISATQFPKQGSHFGKLVRVCFRYDTSMVLLGQVVRDDAEAPWVTMIRLDDGRLVLTTECQYSTIDEPAAPSPAQEPK